MSFSQLKEYFWRVSSFQDKKVNTNYKQYLRYALASKASPTIERGAVSQVMSLVFDP